MLKNQPTTTSDAPFFYQGSLEELFLQQRPLIDVRAPIEYSKGGMPGSINLPLLNDQQRHEIGICYKKFGQEKAIELGHRLVCDDDKNTKIHNWIEYYKKNPDCILYCARGGLRSQISQRWLKENGISLPIIEGGHKRLRNFLLSNLENEIQANSFLVLSGNTGSGKTECLIELQQHGHPIIDLEGLANHRGSAFGAKESAQPSQADFENHLSVQMLKHKNNTIKLPLLIEDESSAIGRVNLPFGLRAKMHQAPIYILESSIEERVEHIFQNYILQGQASKLKGPDLYDYFAQPMGKIKTRLGGVLYQECLNDLQNGNDDTSVHKLGHKAWIEKLLRHYYDPLYEKCLVKRNNLIIGKGSRSDFFTFLKS